ncbi:MAG: fused MFS/spermidine synthase [Rhodocyclaceae bacterium]|jgi:SAM-dependent methyltransferase|nr:fused MFS/spermidine synthase [Rhodocyclaceae bacterium]MCE2979657.1 fused MFS/spermidine synthase [Betaproteobacteria bacterium]MCA3076805.1 fused MFS/spermidine synthase [Rhodocyclaceae bacterium]MCA3091089.1 fused MFS/spermidine synthase [Rhodocyclaceae bacterium]MCA3095189.1 fused MFS/spermidine synthase [Rhodocyclaceae bacterium]
MYLYAVTIFFSAFLLFLVQPLIAKQILPWFGGSSAVWTTCLVFFQSVLLAGYAYTDWTTRRLAPKKQAWLHIGLLVASLAVLPIIADASWKPSGDEDPALRILGLLLATIGLPYLLLSTTGPLVQAWFARTFDNAVPYRLFALSNLASMLALLSYPVAIEPWVNTVAQSWGWSAGYVVFVTLCAAAAAYGLKTSSVPVDVAPSRAVHAAGDAAGQPPTWGALLMWLSLSAMGSVLLLSLTSHMTQNIASVPFLWIVPLSLYLLTFILCFDSQGWYRRTPLMLLGAVLLCVMAWGLHSNEITLSIKVAIPLYCAGLFVLCMFCHGELTLIKPAPRYLTTFYLMISLGGALGGLFVGVLAPHAFNGYWELGIGFVLVALLALIRVRKAPVYALVVAVGVLVFTGVQSAIYVKEKLADSLMIQRNFYGVVRVKDYGDPKTDPEAVRSLVHGVILHGEQRLDPARRMDPTSYYGPASGIGLAIANAPESARHVGVIGLGTGTLATYGRSGDRFRMYEINPQVVDIARDWFSFLKDSKAKVDVVLGDARLQLEREAPQGFDVLAIDAFSSDSIPTHLITKEAMEVYLRHMKPDGVIAFHVTNRFLDLPPVVRRIADEMGLQSAIVSDEPSDRQDRFLSSSDWVLVSRSDAMLQKAAIKAVAQPVDSKPQWRLWTDDFNNLFQILK